MSRRSARIASKMLRWEDIPVSSYEECDEIKQRVIDLQLKQYFLKMGEFIPCEDKEFIGEQYDGILVTTRPFIFELYGTMKTESYTFCLSGRLLRNIEDPDFIEATVCEKGISWDMWE